MRLHDLHTDALPCVSTTSTTTAALSFRGTGSAEFPRSVTDAHFTDIREKELSDLGFVPLCHSPGKAEAAFFTTPSTQKPRSTRKSAPRPTAIWKSS